MQSEERLTQGSFQTLLISLSIAVSCGGMMVDFIEILIFLCPEPRDSEI